MAIALRNSTTSAKVKATGIRSTSKRTRPGKNKAGKPFASGVPTPQEIEQNPELLSGTGRGNPACPTLSINPRKRPSYVTVSEGENGAIRATVRSQDVTGILRAIGKAGYKWQTAATWLTLMCVPLRRNTIVSQVSAGAGYDPKRWGKDKQTLRGPVPDVDPATMRDVKNASKVDPPDFEFA